MRIVVVVKGGLVQAVTADQPAEVLVLDCDTNGVDDSNLFIVNGEEICVYPGLTETQVDPVWVDKCFADVKNARQTRQTNDSVKFEPINYVIYLCNSIGEPSDELPEGITPPLQAELAWLRELGEKEISLMSYIVQLPTGERGILLAEEVCQPESDGIEDIEVARGWGWKTADDAWNWILGIIKKWKNAGFRVLAGYKTGPFDRHELGVFLPWDDISLEKCDRVNKIFEEVMEVDLP